MYFRIVHVTLQDHASSPAYRDQTVEIALGPKGAFKNGNIGTLTRRVAADRVVTAVPERIFTSLPGAADAMAPRLLAAFGADRQRMDRAEEMQNFSGIAPVTKRSGKRTSVHRRWACPKFFRQTFHEFAGYSLKKSAWAKAYYELQRKQGKGHHTAVRALAFKWIRIIFRCWKTHTPYDETIYLEALRRRGSPLVDQLIPAASGQSG